MRLPYIIGEAGSCHMGRLETAIELVNIAADTGCDAVKFQFWSVPGRMRERRKIEGFLSTAYEDGSIRQSWFPFLREETRKRQIDFICTAYLPEDVQTLSNYVDAFKVSSFEIRDQQLIEQIQTFRMYRPVFASFGMTGERNDDGTIDYNMPWDWHKMYCVSAYPCPLEQANLGAIQQGFDGYSDHTKFSRTGALAVTAGADYLEVHFRAEDTPENCPDYPVALTPSGLYLYIDDARIAYKMRGTGEWKPQPCEQKNMKHRVGV